jgi:hypothetical protein
MLAERGHPRVARHGRRIGPRRTPRAAPRAALSAALLGALLGGLLGATSGCTGTTRAPTTASAPAGPRAATSVAPSVAPSGAPPDAPPVAAPVAMAAPTRHALAGPFTPNGGVAWTVELPEGSPPGDTSELSVRSTLVLLEDGRELGPPHASHELIRTAGAGRYCHWGTTLYFSASDDSDPNTNGRQYGYELRAPAAGDEPAAATRIAREIAAGAHTHGQRVQAALAFVHAYSEHRIDEEHDTWAFDTPRVLGEMWDLHTGGTADKPPLSCGPRAYAMQAVLHELGITSRPVQVFSSRGEQVAAHRFLEVLDADTGQWECWDPDQAVSYVDARTLERVGAKRFVLHGPERVVPRRGNRAGWDALELRWLADHDFAAVAFEAFDRSVALRDPVILFDPSRFDPDRVLADGDTFRAWAQRMFGTCRLVAVADAGTYGDAGMR